MGMDVRDAVVFITGANRGIGKSILETALNQGAAKVYAAVRRLETGEQLAESLVDRVIPLRLDLNDPQSIEEAAKTAKDATIVINNAGVLRNATPLADDAIEMLQFEMEVNVYGLMRVAQAFAPVLKANGGGALVQLNSVASMKAFADFATYSASKAASYSITQSLRDMLRDQGTQVLSVHPGPIATDMAQRAGLGEMAEPPAIVSETIFDALRSGDFHAFPDTMARQLGSAYESFARDIIDADLAENA